MSLTEQQRAFLRSERPRLDALREALDRVRAEHFPEEEDADLFLAALQSQFVGLVARQKGTAAVLALPDQLAGAIMYAEGLTVPGGCNACASCLAKAVAAKRAATEKPAASC